MITVKIDPHSAKGKKALEYLKNLNAPNSIQFQEGALTDESMALPGEKVSPTALEKWAVHESNETYGKSEVISKVKSSLAKLREIDDQ